MERQLKGVALKRRVTKKLTKIQERDHSLV